jgi:hypothetical protein
MGEAKPLGRWPVHTASLLPSCHLVISTLCHLGTSTCSFACSLYMQSLPCSLFLSINPTLSSALLPHLYSSSAASELLIVLGAKSTHRSDSLGSMWGQPTDLGCILALLYSKLWHRECGLTFLSLSLFIYKMRIIKSSRKLYGGDEMTVYCQMATYN